METKITITLLQETDENGREQYLSSYENEDDLKVLSYALVSNEMLRQVTLSSAAYILARSNNTDLIEKFKAYTEELNNEIFNNIN